MRTWRHREVRKFPKLTLLASKLGLDSRRPGLRSGSSQREMQPQYLREKHGANSWDFAHQMQMLPIPEVTNCFASGVLFGPQLFSVPRRNGEEQNGEHILLKLNRHLLRICTHIPLITSNFLLKVCKVP